MYNFEAQVPIDELPRRGLLEAAKDGKGGNREYSL
jgi:hypothetical protein